MIKSVFVNRLVAFMKSFVSCRWLLTGTSLGGGVTTKMKNFAYVAKDTSGKTIKGTIEAETANDVLERIHEQGWYCVSYTEALGGGFGKKGIHKFNAKEMSFCCRQLAAMLLS